MKNTDVVLKFKTQDQVTIFENEIMGQISDGHWENSRPHNHWKVWCDATVSVDPNVQGRNFYPSRKYNLLSKEMLSVIGERIMVLVKMGRAFGAENARILSVYLFEFTGEGTGEYSHYEQYTYRGMPDYVKTETGEYYENIRAVIAKFTPEEIKAAAETNTYTRKDMRADLREMRIAMETPIRVTTEAVDATYPDGFLRVKNLPEAVSAPAKPVCQLLGTDGNVFALAGRVSATLRKADLVEKISEFQGRLMSCGSYDDALVLMGEYVEIG